jgi:hypothetical protein
MKKLFLALIYFVSISSFAVNLSEPNFGIKVVAENIVKDPNFANVIKSSCKLKVDIVKQLGLKGGDKLVAEYNSFIVKCPSYKELFSFYQIHNLDTTLLVEDHVSQIQDICVLYNSNPSLVRQTDATKKAILQEAFTLLNNSQFLSENSELQSVKFIQEIKVNPTLAGKLSSAEAIDCVKDAVLGAVSAAGGIIGTIIGLGAEGGLSAAALRGLIRNAVRVGIFAAGGGMIAYMVGCLLWEAWD